jgi:major vault protein
VKQAELKAQSTRIKAEAELNQLKLRQETEIDHQASLNDLELNKAREMADIDAKKFKDIVDSIGPNTIKSIAQAGPEMQAKLLQGLGLKSFMITDGNSPINLFNTASGLMGGSNPQ